MKEFTILISETQFYAIIILFMVWSLAMFFFGLYTGKVEKKQDEEIADMLTNKRPQI